MSFELALRVQCSRWTEQFVQRYKCLPTVLWVDRQWWERLCEAAEANVPQWRPLKIPYLCYHDHGRMIRIYQR